ncbi:MAG: inorganic diphosphatase [Alphaproteobacteria bacterium]|nr:inorganic diphosphatase [Alphaproteobacteria bacterium]
MFIDKISIGKNPPDEINVIVENPVGGAPVKYEIDKDSGAPMVDRFLHVAMQYPGNYGFIPHTLSEDGDPVDVLIVGAIPVVPGAVVAVRPIGVLKMEDEAGGDEKIIAVPIDKLDPEFTDIKNYTDLPESKRKRIEHFFERYKELEPGKWVKLHGWGDVNEAKKMIEEGIERHKKKVTPPSPPPKAPPAP